MPRLSSEVSPSVPHMAVVMAAGSRTSLDKSRSTNFKKSLESESLGGAIGHKKSESFFTDEERSLAEVGYTSTVERRSLLMVAHIAGQRFATRV